MSNSAKFTFSFGMQDTPLAAAGDWALDESQRGRLAELHALLGERAPPELNSNSFSTPVRAPGWPFPAATVSHLPSFVQACRLALPPPLGIPS